MHVLPVVGAASAGRAGERTHSGGILALLAGLAIVPGYIAYDAWAEQQAMIRAWTVKGPPCPVVARRVPPFCPIATAVRAMMVSFRFELRRGPGRESILDGV